MHCVTRLVSFLPSKLSYCLFICLIYLFLRHSDSVLEDKDCENIYELVYCTHRPLAQAAGEFLTLKLFEVDSHAPPTRTRKGKKRSENTPLIRDLVQFFIESEVSLKKATPVFLVFIYSQLKNCLKSYF